MAKSIKTKNSKIITIVLLISIITLIALGITIFSINKHKNKTQPIAIVTNSGNITVNYLEGNKIKLKKASKGDHTYTLSITNNGQSKNYYSIYIKDCVINKNDITVRLETESGEKIYNDQLIEGENLLLTIKSLDIGVTERYKIIINNRSTANIEGEIYVENESLNEQTFADLILNNNNISVAKTNVGVDSSIGDEGLISSMDNDGPTYYFRGAVTNNYLKIGDHMFRIVRINGDETVRIVLDERLDIKTSYNLKTSDDPKTLSGLQESTAKEALNNWYEENLKEYDEFFAQSTFCSDSNFINESVDGKRSNTYQRIYLNNNVSFKCNNNVQKFKVGLLSADEILFAGASKDEANKNYYLHNSEINYSTWTTSSYELKNDGTVTMMVLTQGGGITTGENIISTNGLRPVLNVGKNAHIRGQGTKENPYVLVM